MSDQDLQIKTLQELLATMGFDATIEYDETVEGLAIDCDEHALLIGKKGENLRALQYIFFSIIRRKHPDMQVLGLDVAGYKKERLDKVKKIAEEIAEEVISSGEPKQLPSMNAYERRHAHTVLADNPDITTESEGQDPHRYIVVKKR